VSHFWDAFRVFQRHACSVRVFPSNSIRFLKPEIRSERSVCGNIIVLYECETWFQVAFQNCEKRLLASSCLSVRLSSWNNWARTGRIFMKFDTRVFFENLSKKFMFHYYLISITGTLHEEQYTFLSYLRSILLGMRNVSDKSYRENQMFSNCFLTSCPLLHNVGKYCRKRQATDGNMAHAHCILDT
jgi:hypothetical protein